jgi:hypothetical protein
MYLLLCKAQFFEAIQRRPWQYWNQPAETLGVVGPAEPLGVV